jgi:acyl-CoA reductase-like NAD-dependent aldehyde dehydrogenase
LFLNESLPFGTTGAAQSPESYIETLSATSGLPHVMVRRNMMKLHCALTQMEAILHGLTRRLDWGVLDRGCGEQDGSVISFYPSSPCLGLVMPSNSPGVNSLWLPAIALKIPVIVKPGREEPWTPYRLIQAFIAAGCPPEAFGFYPTDHEGAAEVLKSCGRALVFGDQSTTAPYAGNPGIQIHGPGYSKILIGEDQVDRWPDFLETIVSSVLENGGRSCVNASAVIVPRHGREIADALARRLGPIMPRALSDPEAQLAGFANPKMAEFIDAAIEEGLKVPGATDMTALYREGARKATLDGGTYLRPTIVHCTSFAHPLANREFLCPYASVVEIPQANMVKQIGPSLVVTAITKDLLLTNQLMEGAHIARLNLGPVSTMKISWDQPHEGNMFEFLYQRRAFERLKQW